MGSAGPASFGGFRSCGREDVDGREGRNFPNCTLKVSTRSDRAVTAAPAWRGARPGRDRVRPAALVDSDDKAIRSIE